MKPVADILARIDAEVSAGRTWRAKEILRGAIAGGRADPAILERYGRLLDSLGERVEAGKYLFVCGIRIPEYADAIALFRKRYSKLRGEELATQLPAAVRRLHFHELPLTLQRDLREIGVGAGAFGRKPRGVRAEPTWFGRVADRVAMLGAIAVSIVFLLAVVVGTVVMVKWVWNLFR